MLRVRAQVGFGDDLDDPTLEIAIGQGFSGMIAESGEPDILPDLERSHGFIDSRISGQCQERFGECR